MTANQLTILRALLHRAPGATTDDVELDAHLYRAAKSLERAGLLTTTQTTDGNTFTARLPIDLDS